MAPHTWSHLGDTVSDNKYRMYYRGQRIKEAYYRGEKIWGGDDDLIISVLVKIGIDVDIVGDNLTYSIDNGLRMPIKLTGNRFYERMFSRDPNTPHVITLYGRNVSSIRFRPHNFADSSSKIVKLTDVLSPFGNAVSQITSFHECFKGNEYLESIPSGLFDKCPNVTDFSGCFQSVYNVTEIPSGLFDKCPNVTNFSNCFNGWLKLSTIPSGLFDHCPNVTNFSRCFEITNAISTIPSGLFDHCPNVTNFSRCFATGYAGATTNYLESIPSGLFDHCPNVTDFSECFHWRNRLTAIPSGLFDKCPNVTNFMACFHVCTNVLGNVPPLWIYFPSANGTACFNGCTKAANYNEIPEVWKQYRYP